MTERAHTLFTLGEALAVFLVDDGLPLSRAVQFRRTVAGSECNVAAAFVRLGHAARFVTTVGNDPLGEAVAAALLDWGLDARIGRSDKPTGTLIRGLGAAAPTQAVHLRDGSAATDLEPGEVDAAWDPSVDAVFVTGITAVRSSSARRAVERTVALARESGALVVVDPNLRPRLGTADDFTRALAGIRGLVDIAIGDVAELALLSGVPAGHAADALLDSGCRLVVTKGGADGATATDGTTTVHVGSRALRVVDTVGAGDAFVAALLVGILEQASLADSLDLASRVAADVVGTAGDVEGIRLRHELERDRENDRDRERE